ncbi:hypothetical protein GEMRC1_006859 [Eukaryota sp. GEM-RC1]
MTKLEKFIFYLKQRLESYETESQSAMIIKEFGSIDNLLENFNNLKKENEIFREREMFYNSKILLQRQLDPSISSSKLILLVSLLQNELAYYYEVNQKLINRFNEINSFDNLSIIADSVRDAYAPKDLNSWVENVAFAVSSTTIETTHPITPHSNSSEFNGLLTQYTSALERIKSLEQSLNSNHELVELLNQKTCLNRVESLKAQVTTLISQNSDIQRQLSEKDLAINDLRRLCNELSKEKAEFLGYFQQKSLEIAELKKLLQVISQKSIKVDNQYKSLLSVMISLLQSISNRARSTTNLDSDTLNHILTLISQDFPSVLPFLKELIRIDDSADFNSQFQSFLNSCKIEICSNLKSSLSAELHSFQLSFLMLFHKF